MDDLDLEMEPFDRVQRNDEDISEAMILDEEESEEIQNKVSSPSFNIQGRPYDYVYRLGYQLFHMAQEGSVKDSHLESLGAKLSSFSLHDQHPTQTLHRMVLDTHDKLNVRQNLQESPNSVASHYERFLNTVTQHIPTLPQKSQVLLKNVVSLMNHDLRR
jgi:hypothetical protein